jgi:hypothetical protein
MPNLDHNKPFYKVEVFEPEASSPKWIFSPNVFIDTERPENDGAVPTDVYVSHITVNSRLDGAVNTAELEIRHLIGSIIGIDLSYKMKIYFGFYNKDSSQGPEFSLAFTGKVTQIKNGLEKTTIFLKSSLVKILGKKSEKTFTRMMGFNELIEHMAGEMAGLELAQNGVFNPEINKQPGFGITNTQPLLDHIKSLARYGAMFVFMNINDEFNALAWNPAQLQSVPTDESMWISDRGPDESENNNFYKHIIKFDETLIDINFVLTENKYAATEVVCLKPFSDDPVHTIEPIIVEFDSSDADDAGKPKSSYKVSHVTREDAEKIAENLYWRDAGKIFVNIKLLSAPQIRVHDGVKFDGEIFEHIPFSNLKFNDGSGEKELSEVTFHVSEVQHKFDTVAGYITNVKLTITHIPSGMAPGGAGEDSAAAAEDELEDQELEVEESEAAGATRTLVVISRTRRGEIIANAPFMLTTPDGEERQEETDENGRFELENAEPGTYLVRFLTAEDLEEGEEEEGGGGLLDTAADALGGFL